MDFLHDHRVFMLIVTVAAWAWFISAIMRNRVAPAAAGAGAGRAQLPGTGRQPVGAGRKDIVPQQRTSTGGLAPSIEAGVAEHRVRGSAATAKLDVPTDQKRKPTESLKPVGKTPPPPPTPEQLKSADRILPRTTTASSDIAKAETKTDDEAMEGLFSGLKDQETAEAPVEEQGGPGTRAIKKANRLEEIGFHHQIESEKLPAQPPAPPAPAAATPAPAAQKPPTTATPAPAPAPTPAAPPKPRSQTAELDDILKRIDKVLAENPTPADKPAAPPPPPPAPKPTEKLDPSDVLKRIDEALAESRGGTAAEVTMLDPDWEDDAKRAHTEPSTVENKPAEPAPMPADPKPAAAKSEDEDVPDWAKQDAEDEKDTKGDDGKGGQQKLF